MKNTLLAIVAIFLMSCHGNESADTKPTDLDHTMNKDTMNKSGDTSLQKDTARMDTVGKK